MRQYVLSGLIRVALAVPVVHIDDIVGVFEVRLSSYAGVNTKEARPEVSTKGAILIIRARLNSVIPRILQLELELFFHLLLDLQSTRIVNIYDK